MVDDLTVTQASGRLGCTVTALTSSLARARARVQVLLEQDDDVAPWQRPRAAA